VLSLRLSSHRCPGHLISKFAGSGWERFPESLLDQLVALEPAHAPRAQLHFVDLIEIVTHLDNPIPAIWRR
jgi:hypothetical protein